VSGAALQGLERRLTTCDSSVHVFGDANLDCTFNAADVLYVQRVLIGVSGVH
jgi:hypothetical protein